MTARNGPSGRNPGLVNTHGFIHSILLAELTHFECGLWIIAMIILYHC